MMHIVVLLQRGVIMVKENNLLEIFEELKNYIGSALVVIRVSKSKSKLELAYLLSKEYDWESINANLVDRIETGVVEISFEKLEQICTMLGCTVERILKVAKELRDIEGKPEKELLEEIKEETKYQLWRQQQ